MSRSALLSLLILSGVCSLAESADAQDRNPLQARFILDAGWFFLATDTRVRVDGQTTGQRGTDFDYDDTFGLGDSDRFRADAFWRIADRHALRLMYFENDRSATRSIAREIRFADETFPIGVSVTAEANLAIAQMAYDYALLRRDWYELAAGIGIHVMDIDLGLSATLSGPSGVAARSIEEAAKTTAPLPVIGVRGLWRLPHDFYISAQAQYFYIELDRYSGGLNDLKASLVWQATERVGVGLGYNDFRFSFDIEDEGGFDGRLRWGYGGAVAFATVMF